MSSHRPTCYPGQFEPWDPCYVAPFRLNTNPTYSADLNAKMQARFNDRAVKAAIYANAVILGLTEGE